MQMIDLWRPGDIRRPGDRVHGRKVTAGGSEGSQEGQGRIRGTDTSNYNKGMQK